MRSDNVIEGRFILWQNYLIVNNTVWFVNTVMGDRFVKYDRCFGFMIVDFRQQSQVGQHFCGI